MPIITLVVAFGVGSYVMLGVIPVLGGVFKSLGAKLPLITRIMLRISHNFVVLLGVLAVLAVLTALANTAARRSEKNRIALDASSSRSRPRRRRRHAPRQRARVGVPDPGTSHVHGRQQFRSARGLCGGGEERGPARCLRPRQHRRTYDRHEAQRVPRRRGPDPRDRHIADPRGGKAGTTYTGIAKAAEYHFITADERSAQVADLISPVMTVVVGGFTGALLLAVYLPMFQMYALIGKTAA